jgi:hypothetical protein
MVAVRFDAAQFLDPRHVQHLRELHVHLGDPQADVGAAGDDLGAGAGAA